MLERKQMGVKIRLNPKDAEHEESCLVVLQNT